MVVEYSEISPSQATARDARGRLKFNWSNICMHYFSVAWLHEVVKQLESDGARCAYAGRGRGDMREKPGMMLMLSGSGDVGICMQASHSQEADSVPGGPSAGNQAGAVHL